MCGKDLRRKASLKQERPLWQEEDHGKKDVQHVFEKETISPQPFRELLGACFTQALCLTLQGAHSWHGARPPELMKGGKATAPMTGPVVQGRARRERRQFYWEESPRRRDVFEKA